MDRVKIIKTKLFAVEILRLFKEEYPYERLSSFLNLPIPVLSRYVNGKVLPSLKRAKEIIKLFKETYLKDLILRKISWDETGAMDHTPILFDINLLDKIAKVGVQEFIDKRIDKILTLETDGIPLAVLMGKELGVDVVITKYRKEMGVKEFIDVKQIRETGMYTYVFVPKNSIKRGENILLVDDFLRDVYNVDCMVEICKVAKANVVGMFVMFAIGKKALNYMKKSRFPIKALMTFS